MSTFMPKAETVERKWYILDAAGKPLGRVAAKAAHILVVSTSPHTHLTATVAIM